MDLPLRAMQTALVRRCGSGDTPWHRSRIVDFTPELEIVLLLPDLAGAAGRGPIAGPERTPASGAHDPETAGGGEDEPAAELI